MVWGELESFMGWHGNDERGIVYGMSWEHDGNQWAFIFLENNQVENRLIFLHDWVIDGMGWSPHLGMGFDFSVDVGCSNV